MTQAMSEKMRVALCGMTLRENSHDDEHYPIAIADLKAYSEQFALIKERVDIRLRATSVSDFNLMEECAQIIDLQPRIVGVSCYIWNVDFYSELLRELRKTLKNSIFIAGGPHVHPGILRDIPELDIAVIGEGEATFHDLISRLVKGEPVDDLKGAAFREGSKIRINQPRPPLENLCDIPSPYLAGILKPKRVMQIEYSRGCAYNCSFCVNAGQQLRFFPIERIESEIAYCAKNNLKVAFFIGSYLNHKDFGVQVLKMIKRHIDCGEKIDITGSVFIDSNQFDEDFYNLLNDIVSKKQDIILTSGFQCCHTETRNINKCFNSIENIRKMVSGRPFSTMVQCILGLPGDNTLRSAATIAAMADCEPDRIQCLPLIRLPNTRLFIDQYDDSKPEDPSPAKQLSTILSEKDDLRTTCLMAESFLLEYHAAESLTDSKQLLKKHGINLQSYK